MKIIFPYFKTRALYLVIARRTILPSEVMKPPFWTEPFSEDSKYVFEIDSKNLGLTIDYHITDWYINENYYLEKSIVYNSVSIFALIDNVKYIKFNFSGKSYIVTRDNVINNFPN